MRGLKIMRFSHLRYSRIDQLKLLVFPMHKQSWCVGKKYLKEIIPPLWIVLIVNDFCNIGDEKNVWFYQISLYISVKMVVLYEFYLFMGTLYHSRAWWWNGLEHIKRYLFKTSVWIGRKSSFHWSTLFAWRSWLHWRIWKTKAWENVLSLFKISLWMLLKGIRLKV